MSKTGHLPPGKTFISKNSCRWIIRLVLGSVALYLALFMAIFLYFQHDPQAIADRFLARIANETGLQFHIGSLEVTLVPMPAIAASDVEITGKNLNMTIAWCQLAPDLSRIFTGDILPGTITILRPRISIDTSLTFNELIKTFKAEEKKQHKPTDFPAMTLDILDMGLTVKAANNMELRLTGIESRMESLYSSLLVGMVQTERGVVLEAGRAKGMFEKVYLAGILDPANIFSEKGSFNIAGNVNWTNLLRKTQFDIAVGSSGELLSLNAVINGSLDRLGKNIPFSLKGGAGINLSRTGIGVRNLAWELGPDSGSLNLFLSEKSGEWNLKGSLRARRISLPQWFGFARNFPPGLQMATDNITQARLDFTITPEGMTATNISAQCQGAVLKGSGSVPNWKKPSVNLELATPFINLGAVVPEALGSTPPAPFFYHKPFTPLPGKPLLPGETGIDYDVRLKAATLEYGPTKINNASLRIYPGKMDVSGLQDILLEGGGKLFGGDIHGLCILGADPSLPMHITAEGKNVNGQKMGQALPMQPIRQGTFSASGTFTSRGKELWKFLDNLRGDWQMQGQKARLEISRDIYPEMRSSGSVHGASWNGRQFAVQGKWSAAVTAPLWKGQTQLDGKLVFSKNGVQFQKMPASLNFDLSRDILPAGNTIKASGNFSGQSDTGRFQFDDAKVDFAGLALKGHMRYDTGKNTVEGRISTQIAKPDKAFARLGLRKVTVPPVLSPIAVDTSFSAKADALKLSDMKCKLGNLEITGSTQWEIKNNRSFYTLQLDFGKINLGDYIRENQKNQGWNYPFMNAVDAQGNIRIKALTAYDIQMHNISVGFRLKGGLLELEPVNANFYDAPLSANATLDFRKGLGVRVSTQINAFDLGKAIRDRKTQVIVKGLANLKANINAVLTGNSKVAPNLYGTWNMAVNNGSWQSLKNGSPADSPVNFARASASGDIKAGVVNSQDFKMTSPEFIVDGKGWYNLQSNKLDCTFNVNMKGLPDFPLYVYGPVNNLQKRIGAGKMIINAVGGAASGFVNAIGSALKGAWNIFSR